MAVSLQMGFSAGTTVSIPADLMLIPSVSGPVPGFDCEQLHIQYWYRDAPGGVLTSNLSNARLVILTP